MSNSRSLWRLSLGTLALTFAVGGCGGRSGGGAMVPAGTPAAMQQQDLAPDVSILSMLHKQVVIGSTIDPKFHQRNPYGLDIARSSHGKFKKGDLAACNFNDKANVQGTGFTIVALHPVPGSQPRLVSADKTVLTGCDALALAPNDIIWAAAFSSNDNPVLAPSGKLLANISGKPLDRPFGQAFAQPLNGKPVFYESNAGDGTIVRINLTSPFTFDVIAKGFPVNHGVPGSIFGPSGLQYDQKLDTLYIVDGTNNTVVAFSKVTTIKAGGITVEAGGKTFSGPSASLARVVHAGPPLNGPISSALFFDGHLAIGNTTNRNGQNLIIELSRKGHVLAIRNVDRGPAGALFGMVATGDSAADTKLYFNDDNDNNVQVLEP